ncbi:MAG: NCS2 family permease, partial [Eggerthellaceae bacterium]
LASLVTGLLFLLAIFLSPVFLAIPTFATAPALVFVGILMASAFKEIDFTEDIAASLGAFMAIAMMPFTYSIANGIMFGILAFVIVRVFQGRAKDVAPIMWIAAVLFAIRIATLVI